MARWVECKSSSDDKIFLNFDNAISITRNYKGSTEVIFGSTGSAEGLHCAYVKETPNEIFSMLANKA